MKLRVALLVSVAVCSANIVVADSLEKLADDFWAWRARYAPFTGDDVNRMERPGGTRDWSRASIDQRRKRFGRIRGALEKPQARRVADPEAGRLQIDRLGIVACALGARD